jgi:hypothetical protein
MHEPTPLFAESSFHNPVLAVTHFRIVQRNGFAALASIRKK